MSCQSRVYDRDVEFEEQTCFIVKECGKPTKRTELVDDGDAKMFICSKCFPAYKNKKMWLGWFDCDIPTEANIKRVFKNYYKRGPTEKDFVLEEIKTVREKIYGGSIDKKSLQKEYENLIRLTTRLHLI